MNLPDSLTERLPFLESFEEDWQPVSHIALVAWLAFYLLFLFQAARGRGLLLMMDLVFVPIHEGGHLLFRWSGSEWLYVAGGTILQLFVPFALAAYFAFKRQPPGTAFCAFFFFEQLLPISKYMADARSMELPLLTVGDGGFVIHDWHYLFSRLGLLNYDSRIAQLVRSLGWLGMLAAVLWLCWRARRSWPAK